MKWICTLDGQPTCRRNRTDRYNLPCRSCTGYAAVAL